MRIDRRRKLNATVLLRAMGMSADEILAYYYGADLITFGKRGVVTKILVRGPFDNEHDVCYALVPRAGMPWVIKTTWLNHLSDTHRLVKSRDRYTKP